MHLSRSDLAMPMLKRACSGTAVACLFGCASTPVPHVASANPELNGYQLVVSANTRVISEMKGPMLASHGSASELVAKAQYCVPRILDTSARTQTSLDALVADLPPDVQVDGGDPEALIESVDRDQGQLVANNRSPFSHASVSYVARSKLAVKAQEGEFRIIQSNLRFGNSTTVNVFPSVVFGSDGWDDALTALQRSGNKLAACIADDSQALDH
ncbi:MAG: hypothetical protein JWR16_3314 [Nevskia sp.]|nr:hypothetical protein [Nevskia sp.]